MTRGTKLAAHHFADGKSLWQSNCCRAIQKGCQAIQVAQDCFPLLNLALLCLQLKLQKLGLELELLHVRGRARQQQPPADY